MMLKYLWDNLIEEVVTLVATIGAYSASEDIIQAEINESDQIKFLNKFHKQKRITFFTPNYFRAILLTFNIQYIPSKEVSEKN